MRHTTFDHSTAIHSHGKGVAKRVHLMGAIYEGYIENSKQIGFGTWSTSSQEANQISKTGWFNIEMFENGKYYGQKESDEYEKATTVPFELLFM